MKKLKTENYKGVRDFYPKDVFVQKYIFQTWTKTVESFGFEEYNASLLENSEIYKAKTSEEIINNQTYSFVDRGDREVTLRPEMTPTLARMIAAKKRELSFPLRYYSIPNCFRYERPQRGRLREFWQLNVDILNVKNDKFYDIEVLKLINQLLLNFKATPSDFTIKINSRTLLNSVYENYYEFNENEALAFQRLSDKKDKITDAEFKKEYEKITDKDYKDIVDISDKKVKVQLEYINEIIKAVGIPNIEFDQNIVRGFDYYTGIVFEVFDTNPENNRALFGGGRYSNLIDLFETVKDDVNISGIGFGIGDVPMMNFLESRNLLPEFVSSTDVLVGILSDDEKVIEYADGVANELRANGKNVSINYDWKKVGDYIKMAEKNCIQSVVVIGEKETEERRYEVKRL
ncbi:histidine--tRNA ligase [Arenimonas sp.]|nr:histidine--tRNA ligase [Candidatus Parcubacteria bacterium]